MAEPSKTKAGKAASTEPPKAPPAAAPDPGEQTPPEPPKEPGAEPADDAPVTTDKPDSKDEAPTFSHERLIQRAARTIGYPAHVVAGALAGVEKENLTIEEARAACEQWVKSEPGEKD